MQSVTRVAAACFILSTITLTLSSRADEDNARTPHTSLMHLFGRRVPMDEVPSPVQARMRQIAADDQIKGIERERTDAGMVYIVELRDNRKPRHLRISEKGELLSDSYGPNP